MFCRRLLLLLSLFSSDCLLSQPLEPKYFNHYTTTSGLSHNTVTALAQDSTGYIWITTPYGLNRFNGQQFVQFHSTSDPLSPPAEDLGPAWWLNKELLAVYSSGLHIINTRTGERRNLFVPYHRQQLQYKFNGIVAARGDDDSSIYVLSGSGFYHFNKDHQLLSRYDHYSEAEVPVAYFVFGRELFVLDKNRLLIIAIDGFHVYDKRTRRLKKITAEDVPLLSPFFSYPNDFYTFFQPAPGQLFAIKAHSDSIFYLNFLQNKNQVSRLPFNTGKEGFHWRSRMVRVNDTLFYVSAHETGFYKLQFFPGTGKLQLHPHKYFSDYQCLAMLVDREQKLWVATAKGLFRQDEGRSQVTIAPLPSAVETAYPNTAFDGLFVTADKVLVGARSPGNILVYDKKTLQFLRITDLDAFRKKTGSTFNVYNIEAISDTRLALAVNGPPLLMNRDGTNPQILTLPQWHGWAAEVYNDSKGATWISSMKVYRYYPDEQTVIIPEQELLTNGVEVPEIIREDADHNIWMTRHGLSRYNVLKGRFDLRLDSFPFIKMPDKQVSDMVIDKERNTLWIGSHNNGLMAYDIAAKTFRHFTTADGLPGNNITALIIVGGRLWMTGTVSLACLDLRSLKITGFGKEDGFPDMPILNRADFFYDSLSQQLYIAYSKAVARFNPSALLQRKSPPHVFIESISLNGVPQPLFPQHEVSTAWNRNEISITIGSIHYSPEAGQRFAYRILNDEAAGSWVELGRQPSFSISGLAPGSHRIQVKVYSVNNRWPAQVKELSVVVTPPFWMTAWFISLLSVLVAVSIYQLVRWRTNIVKRKEMIKTQIEKLKADDYKNQFELEQITNYFSSSLAGKKTEEDVLWDVSRNLIGRLNYEDCIIYLWNKDKTKMIQKAAYGPKGKPEMIYTNIFEVLPGQGIVGHVIETKQPVLVNDTSKDPRYRIDDDFRLSELTVPIIHNNELLGIIDSEHHQPYYFSERDIKILTTIATLLGNKLVQLESEQSLEAKQRELTNINEQLAEARLSALQAQMNPHFVFNALNSIKRMILDSDNEKASRYLSKFALMIRLTLEHSKEIFVTLDANIAYLKSYLQMEQLRFDSFTYTISIDDKLDTAETMVPSMMIQPLVENAIWHGLMQAEGEKCITIGFMQCANNVVCTVEDNGIGIRRSEQLKAAQRPLHRSVGLENLQNRIKIMNEKYDLNCSLRLVDLGDIDNNKHGTRVILQFYSITP